MTEMDVDPAAIDAAHTQVLTSAGKIAGLLEGLAAYLRPMQSTWSGAAADAADGVIEAWTASATALNDLLVQIGTALDTVGENYTATETANAGIWQTS